MTRNQIKAVTAVVKKWNTTMTPEDRFEYVADILEALKTVERNASYASLQGQMQNVHPLGGHPLSSLGHP